MSPSFIVLPEEDILYNEQSNDINQKTRIARMISNRIAAQWFGGITNPEEFGTFWLNEALPRFLEVEALEKILDINSVREIILKNTLLHISGRFMDL